MALNAGTLAAAIQAKLIANPASGALPGPALDALCSAIAEAVIEHIVASAVLVTACPAGTGSGTVT